MDQNIYQKTNQLASQNSNQVSSQQNQIIDQNISQSIDKNVNAEKNKSIFVKIVAILAISFSVIFILTIFTGLPFFRGKISGELIMIMILLEPLHLALIIILLFIDFSIRKIHTKNE